MDLLFVKNMLVFIFACGRDWAAGRKAGKLFKLLPTKAKKYQRKLINIPVNQYRPDHTLFLASRKRRDKTNITPTQSQPCKRTKNLNEQFFDKPCNNYRFTKFTNDSTSPALFSIHRLE